MTMRSWQSYKEEGSTHYHNSDYTSALECYNKALTFSSLHDLDRQALLSNVVLCRLYLYDVSGSSSTDEEHTTYEDEDDAMNMNMNTTERTRHAHLHKALVEARECISVSRGSWAKAHYRLACVYVRMGRSNDACNSLQKALRIDSGYQRARALLMQELRRRDVNTAQQEEQEHQQQQQQQHTTTNTSREEQGREVPETVGEEEAAGWKERLQYHIQTFRGYLHVHMEHMKMWYSAQNEVTQLGIQFIGALVVLYVCFGGRFGFGWEDGSSSYSHSYSSDRRQYINNNNNNNNNNMYRGNYGDDNAYSHYRYANKNEYASSYYDNKYDDGYDEHYYNRPSARRSSSSFHLFDGSLLSMAVLMAFMFGANRFFGINPFQALWALQVLTGGRRRMGFGGGGLNFLRMGGRGGGFGFGGRARRQQRGGFW